MFSSADEESDDDQPQDTIAVAGPSAPSGFSQSNARGPIVQPGAPQLLDGTSQSWIDFTHVDLAGFHKPKAWSTHMITAWWWHFGGAIEENTEDTRWWLCKQCHTEGSNGHRYMYPTDKGGSNVKRHLLEVHGRAKTGLIPATTRQVPDVARRFYWTKPRMVQPQRSIDPPLTQTPHPLEPPQPPEVPAVRTPREVEPAPVSLATRQTRSGGKRQADYPVDSTPTGKRREGDVARETAGAPSPLTSPPELFAILRRNCTEQEKLKEQLQIDLDVIQCKLKVRELEVSEPEEDEVFWKLTLDGARRKRDLRALEVPNPEDDITYMRLKLDVAECRKWLWQTVSFNRSQDPSLPLPT
ncbi:hypothetical protein W97_04572 [Coniosporium apollinis CBS 100218]|uniref:BED-type domain-containing protein n=1 Tax=Coniosporium apollinis (strain CBS 100218) TaxID=1168221 RepID=R7YU44_CONA1|nr:uncharacterized protein W97_04572 [Coniosporium apollinis CBS 100218]EON65334.1 hypothetical protein W97_04572 [Coniosporium apollinis CBS 100218]